MNDKKYCKLVMVTSDNNNKYYEMIWEGGSSFVVNYGRVELTKTTVSYPYYQWSKKYAEKIKKGYKDITHLVSVDVKEKEEKKNPSTEGITDQKVKSFLTLMEGYKRNLVQKTYSVKADRVSQAQLDSAQNLIDEISELSREDKKNQKKINDKLLELYTTIPRYMKNTRNEVMPHIDIHKRIIQEQDNLDAMASEVKMSNLSKNIPTKTKDEVKPSKKTLLDVLGLKMDTIDNCPDIKYLLGQIGKKKIQGIFSVDKHAENCRFDTWMTKQKNNNTRILIHGTRCSSVIPILEQGLKIRPSGNYQFSGKAYGEGNYFSEVVDKSLGYTGYDSDKVLLVYEVHTGNPFIYDSWYRGNSFSLTYKNLQERGYDSTFVKAGNGLRNSEIIAYKEDQARIKYIIWL